MNILIVEDDRIQATSLKLKLRQLGLNNVDIATNGHQALTLCLEKNISLVFCDIHMPEMDGVTLLSMLGEKYPSLGIIILSAVDDAVLDLTYNMCCLADFNFVDVLRKPYSVEQLESLIQSYHLKYDQQAASIVPISLSDKEIETAFNEDWLFNYYQPQFDFKTGAMVGVEALVRLDHPIHGVLSPAHFLSLIEELNLMDKLFLIVLDKALSALGRLSADLQLSINISQSNLQQLICDPILTLCHKYAFPTDKLTLELTEDHVYNGTTASLANLARLRMHGVGLSIDDFGTGYASLSQLSKLPFTELKVDQSFVRDLSTNYKNQQLTNMCLLLAQSLGLHCVVEGVEDEDTWQYLRHLGVDTCQGYYSARPMPIGDLAELYSKNISKQLSHQSIDDGVHCLLVGENSISANALRKMLMREERVTQVALANDLDCTTKKLRDLPFNLVVVDSYYSHDARLELYQHIESINFKGRLIFLNEYHATIAAGLTQARHIVKSAALTDTIQSLMGEVGQTVSFQPSFRLNERLSSRELSVANLLIQGLTNKQIANQLDINQKTVSTYKARIQSKLGIRSAMELIRYIELDHLN
ncbi:diguanylate phosphodiesterase [Vibrio qinghaiensis]|uniref:Diguanylate phosphodiesterase n=1 Tax=Vibrio qinghaiensis TaxID=2025808 RepID=A0A223MWD3_9VIBR|nr:EAL domain-containing protein [Vibrio qinghaiensis]ASU21902.1 diguanylate phosphodiesterase [Vibrio qinghaiensis]